MVLVWKGHCWPTRALDQREKGLGASLWQLERSHHVFAPSTSTLVTIQCSLDSVRPLVGSTFVLGFLSFCYSRGQRENLYDDGSWEQPDNCSSHSPYLS